MRYPVSALLLLLFAVQPLVADPLLGLPELPVPKDNPQSDQKIALGKKLFNDKRLSDDGSISCASCHSPELAFTDGLAKGRGIRQLEGERNSPTVVNAAFYTSLFLDGRRDSLEQQAGDPLLNPIEHGLKNYQPVLDVIQQDPDYQRRFHQVFKVPPNEITMDHALKSIASFERTVIAGNSPFDRFFFARDKSALSKSAQRGLNLFRRKGNCANCHEISWGSALLTDNLFYNIGVGMAALKPVLTSFINSAEKNRESEVKLNPTQRSELGRFSVTRRVADIGKFRTPTLRNIAVTGPYMHNGSIETLAEVVEYYDQGGEKNPMLDPAIFPLKLTKQEKADLVAFLQALTSPAYQVNKPHRTGRKDKR